MHNHDEMVILCNEKALGKSHKLNGTPTLNIAINGLKLHLFGISFAIFELIFNKL